MSVFNNGLKIVQSLFQVRFILLKIVIYLTNLVGEFCCRQMCVKTGYSALADAVTVALSTAVTDLFCCSQQCGKARSIFGSLASLSKLSRNPWISPMTLIVLSPDSFYFILALWL
jgi:hypothetical protein